MYIFVIKYIIEIHSRFTAMEYSFTLIYQLILVSLTQMLKPFSLGEASGRIKIVLFIRFPCGFYKSYVGIIEIMEFRIIVVKDG